MGLWWDSLREPLQRHFFNVYLIYSLYTKPSMGNDGGSIPDRRDLVRTKGKAEQADKANQTRARWFFCALSKVRLFDLLLHKGHTPTPDDS